MATKEKTTKKEENFKYLVIVESPAKSKTLTKILGKDYLVKSSIGHIRDLPAKGLGIKVKENFEPTYEILKGKEKVVNELNTYAKKAELVYLASDPDREGEAIAWHLSHVLKVPKKKISRITFNQITPDAVTSSVKNPRDLDLDLVDAQQARRILDRLVGYKISPLLWRKIGGRSAGRVQSIAVRLICEREEEIRGFDAKEYWSIKANVDDQSDSKKQVFEVNLVNVEGKRVSSPKDAENDKNRVISSEAEVEEIVKKINASELAVSSVASKTGTRNAKPPFKTSTLQRAASNALGYTVKRTMQIAQGLYEGVKLGRAGDQTGLITYMRTDSLRLAPEALEAAKEYIVSKWGEDFYPGEATNYDKSKKTKKAGEKADNTQDAHEAIRPTYADKSPDSIKQFLTDDQYKLYKLIWERFITSQMSPMKLETKSVEISDTDNQHIFRASASKIIFPGYSIVFGKNKEASEDDEAAEENTSFPHDIEKGHKINLHEVLPHQHFTEPPPRYNEASLVKTLEEKGIGRPSTYAPTIATVLDRKYVEKLDGKALAPTKLGITVNKLLVDHFGEFINETFTSQMEDNLDKISVHGLDWHKVLSEFYFGPDGPPPPKSRKKPENKTAAELKAEEAAKDRRAIGFDDIVKKASKDIENVVIETEFKCPTCEAPMNLKGSRFGPFLGCSNYPDCNTIVNLTKEGTPAPEDRPYEVEDCEKCNKKSSLVIRYGRYGDYIACTTEDCGFTSPIQKKLGIKCPREGCPGELVEKKSRFGKVFYGCNSWSQTKCETVFWYPPIDPALEECPECKKPVMYKTLKRGDKIACSDTKGCGYARLASPKDIENYRPKFEEIDKDAPENKSVFSIN